MSIQLIESAKVSKQYGTCKDELGEEKEEALGSKDSSKKTDFNISKVWHAFRQGCLNKCVAFGLKCCPRSRSPVYSVASKRRKILPMSHPSNILMGCIAGVIGEISFRIFLISLTPRDLEWKRDLAVRAGAVLTAGALAIGGRVVAKKIANLLGADEGIGTNQRLKETIGYTFFLGLAYQNMALHQNLIQKSLLLSLALPFSLLSGTYLYQTHVPKAPNY